MRGKERITHAAIISAQGMIFLGKSHADCFHQAGFTGVETSNAAGLQGFFTNRGRFVSRATASVIAHKAKQISKVVAKMGTLCSEDLWSPRHEGQFSYDSVKGYFLKDPTAEEQT